MSPKENHKERLAKLMAVPDDAESNALAPIANANRVSSPSVKGVDRTFNNIDSKNKELEDKLANAERVIEIDPELVVPSFVKDRLDTENDVDFQAFVEGIREIGQKLPILVRPLPKRPGHFQAAYGHRRLRACQILKRPVKAIVRELTEEELVIAQGVENSERLNLSFIEQALFALRLSEKGYDRELIAKALGRKEGQRLAYISILTSTASMIPTNLIVEIGPAASIGRPKWEKLGSLITAGKLSARQADKMAVATKSSVWRQGSSDQRFKLAFEALNEPMEAQSESTRMLVNGGVSIQFATSGNTTRIVIPDTQLPGLSSWLRERFPSLIEEFQSAQDGGDTMS